MGHVSRKSQPPGVSGRSVIGFDVAAAAGNGQIVSVLGFLDKVPA
jgi:hypothetical protein